MPPFREPPHPRGLLFRDFRPAVLREGGILDMPTFESLEKVVETASNWTVSSHVEVVNVETLLLPSLTLTSPKTTPTTACFSVGPGSVWYQIVRVWFRDPGTSR